MLDPLDIFKMQKTYVWKAAATTFEVATSKMNNWPASHPAKGQKKLRKIGINSFGLCIN
jgi:hypothetical protein